MTVSITMYGNDNNYWNAGPGDGPSVGKNIYISTNSSANLLNFSATFGTDVFTGTAKGIFQFNGPISTLDMVSGVMTEFTVYKNGFLNERDVFTQGTDLINWITPPSTAAQYIAHASTLDSGVVFVGSQGTGPYGDTLIGGTSKDLFTSYAGNKKNLNSYFDGRQGVDSAIMQGKLAEYKLETKTFTDNTDMNYVRQVSGWWATDSVANRNGTTQLVNVERLKFTDTNVALDIGPYQNAGAIYMLYKATFNRAPDNSGMGYWLSQVDSGKNLVTNIAQSFLSTPEFIAKYGTNPSNATYIDKLYQNVLGRSGDAGGVAYWNQQLDSGAVSKAAALVSFATLPEGASNVASLIANGIPYTEWVG